MQLRGDFLLTNNLEELRKAAKHGYAIPAINTQGGNYDIIRAVCKAADELRFEELFPREKTAASSSYFVKIFNEVIMGYWKHLVSMRADAVIDMDIIDAL